MFANCQELAIMPIKPMDRHGSVLYQRPHNSNNYADSNYQRLPTLHTRPQTAVYHYPQQIRMRHSQIPPTTGAKAPVETDRLASPLHLQVTTLLRPPSHDTHQVLTHCSSQRRMSPEYLQIRPPVRLKCTTTLDSPTLSTKRLAKGSAHGTRSISPSRS